jgi:hypothetical protein
VVREPGRRGRVSAVSLSELVASGTLTAEDTLVAAYRGQRFEATFDATTEAVDVTGGNGKSSNGWKFWCVQRPGRVVSLDSLRVSVQA